MEKILLDNEGYFQFNKLLEELESKISSVGTDSTDACDNDAGNGWHDNFAFEALVEESRNLNYQLTLLKNKSKCIELINEEYDDNLININDTIEIKFIESNDIDTLRQLPHVYDIKYDDKNLDIFFSEGKNNLVRVINYLQEKNISFSRVHSVAPTLNDVFLEITGKELRD